MESGHELQVVCQRPELGRAAQLELHPLIHIEWLVEVVGLNAQHVAVWATLEERQTVDDPPRIPLGQHALRAQPVGLDEIGILQGPKQAECGFLERHIHAGVDGDIEPVQLIEAGHPQHLSQLLTHDTGSSLASHECRRAGGNWIGEPEGNVGDLSPEVAIEDSGRLEQIRVRRDALFEGRVILEQIEARSPHRTEQGQHVLERPGLLRSSPRTGQGTGDILQLKTKPPVQALSQPRHLTQAGDRGQRHRVQIVDDDPAPMRPRVRTVLVGLEARRRQLLELVCRGIGSPFRGMAILLQLRGQGATALDMAGESDLVSHIEHGGLGQARPVHGRVAAGIRHPCQIAVLDVEQCVHDQGRHVFEPLIEATLRANIVDRHALGADLQACRGRLPVGRSDLPRNQSCHLGGLARLLHDLVAARLQAILELGDQRVAPSSVERPSHREGDGGARPRVRPA